MLIKFHKLFFVAISVLLLFASFRSLNIITKEKAIEVAENFIRINGYTAAPAVKSQLSYELSDQFYSVDALLKHRYNSLHEKAFCIAKYRNQWYVGFLSSTVKPDELDSIQRKSDLPGRAVIVPADGKEVRMAHKEPMFSLFDKL